MVEPDWLACYRMRSHCGPQLPGSQTPFTLPFSLDSVLAAIVFDELLVFALEDRLPGQAETIIVVSHIEHLLLAKAFYRLRRDALKYVSHVSYWSFAPCGRRFDTAKINL